MLDELSGIMGFNYINMIRMLPEDRFSAIRDNYAIAMVQTSIYVFNKFIRDRSWPVIWIENAGYLATSPATKSEIAVKLEEVNGIVARQSRNKKKNPVGAYFWVIIVVVRLFAWMISEATTSNNSYQYSPTNFTVSPSISTPATRDSLIKALLLRNHKDSTGAHPLQNNNVHPVPKH